MNQSGLNSCRNNFDLICECGFVGVPYQQTAGGPSSVYPSVNQSSAPVDSSGITLAPPPYTPHLMTSITEDDEDEAKTDGQTQTRGHHTQEYDNNKDNIDNAIN